MRATIEEVNNNKAVLIKSALIAVKDRKDWFDNRRSLPNGSVG